MEGIALFPWQAQAWRQLEAYLRLARLSQALLITGPSGLGKGQLAQRFACTLLCQNQSACGQCSACRLLEAGNHPDYLTLIPETGKELTIESIRDLIEKLALKPHYGLRRVAVIHACERMNLAAANCFLKTLEEPALGTVIVALSALPSRLPATIRSRCQHVRLVAPPLAVSVPWLEHQGFAKEKAELALLQNGRAPLAARAWLHSDLPEKRCKFLESWIQLLAGQKDPVLFARDWSDEPLEHITFWLLTLVADLARLAMGLRDSLLNPDQNARLHALAKKLNLTRLLAFWQRLLEVREVLDSQLNQALLLESLLLASLKLKV